MNIQKYDDLPILVLKGYIKGYADEIELDKLWVETYKGTFFPMRFKSSLNPS